ncbi:kinase-like domain-containing protein [Abortiporus biennis]|nr:kinase-like domain-containing protein [Abortiporus biennis]
MGVINSRRANLTTEDSGRYRCEVGVTTKKHENLRGLSLESSAHFSYISPVPTSKKFRKFRQQLMAQIGTCAICLKQTKVHKLENTELLCFSNECRTAWEAFHRQLGTSDHCHAFRAISDPTQSPIWLLVRSASVNLDTNDQTMTQFNNYRGNKLQAQVLVDIIQEIINNDSIWENTNALFSDLRRRLRLLLVRFWALRCRELVIALEREITIPGDHITDRIGGRKPPCSQYGKYKGKKVLIKFPLKMGLSAADIRTQVREIMLLRNLKHDRIIPFLGIYYDAMEDHGGPGIVLPCMYYGNVREFLASLMDGMFVSQGLQFYSVITQPKIHQWMLQMADALAYLHREDVVHGDVRAHNFLVNDDLNLCMIDFNMALYASGRPGANQSTTNTMSAWCSPELWAEGVGAVRRSSKPSDVWAFGCVCIELYTAKDPLKIDFKNYPRTDKSVQWIRRILKENERPPRPLFYDGQAMPDNLWTLISECCWYARVSSDFRTVDTSERWTAEQVFAALKHLYSAY